MLSDGKWTRICDSSLLTSKLQLRENREKNIALNLSKSGKTVVGVPNLRVKKREALHIDANKEKTGDREENFVFRVSRCPFRRCKLTNRW